MWPLGLKWAWTRIDDIELRTFRAASFTGVPESHITLCNRGLSRISAGRNTYKYFDRVGVSRPVFFDVYPTWRQDFSTHHLPRPAKAKIEAKKRFWGSLQPINPFHKGRRTRREQSWRKKEDSRLLCPNPAYSTNVEP